MPTYTPSAGTKLYYGDEVTAVAGSEALRMAAIAAAAATQMAAGDVKKWGALPSSPRAKIDVTRANATDEDGNDLQHEEYAPGWAAPSTMEFDMALHDAEVQTLESLKEAGLNHSFAVRYKNGAQRVFTGYLAEIKPSVEDKGEIIYSVTIQATGRLYYLAASTVSILQSVTVHASKTLCFKFSGTVTPGDFILANLGVVHAGTLTPAGTITAGATAKEIYVSAAGFQADPTGDTYVLNAAPNYVRPAPTTGIVRAL